MGAYKVNLKFKENGKSLNDVITNVLKIELGKQYNATCNILNKEMPFTYINSFQKERNMNK